MANLGNSNFLANQKRRNFIYNSAASRARDRGAIAAQPLAETSSALFRAAVPNATYGSPYKRLKISDDSQGERAEQFAAEEACRDLPVDAFDEELGAIDEEFDDDLLTAEQLDECDRIASIELQTQGRYLAKFTSNLPQTIEQRGVSGNKVPSSLHENPGEFFSEDEDDSLATNCTQEYVVCQISTTTTSSKVQTTSSSMAGFPGSGPRMLQPAFETLPRKSNRADVVTPKKKGDTLVESFVDQSRGSNSFIPATNMAVAGITETAIIVSNDHSNYIANVDHSENGQMQSLRKEIEQLRADFLTASAKVKTLEEERFCKDGEIRILRDSLRHFEGEEKRRQGEVKALELQRAREKSQHEKDLEKQVENLMTQLKFKDREISQMIERNKKRASSSTEPCSPVHKKFVHLSEVFPTGNSFFQKSSPEGKVKSPRGMKPGVKDLRSPGKQNTQRLSEAENSENSGLSGTSSEASSAGKLKTHQRLLCPQGSLDVDLVQNLLSPQDKESHAPFQNPDNRAAKDGSIISLLTLDTPSANYARNIIQRTAVSETDASCTLHLFDTQATSRLKKSIEDVMQKDSSTCTHNNSLVVGTLTSLLNQSHIKSLEENKSTAVSSKFSHNYNLPAATNFLPLLESHIVHFIESRTDTNEENIPATCLARHSQTPDSPDSKHSLGFESDQAKTLAVLHDNVLVALRLLNILVLYSSEVCDCILKSARVFNQTDSNQGETNKEVDTAEKREKIFSSSGEDDGFCQHPLFPSLKIAVKKDPDKQLMNIKPEEGSEERSREEEVVQHTELLGYLFKLLMTQPKESMALAYATLQVLTSLARNCEVKYCTRLLPLLSENLLSECLSRDCCLTSLSLITTLLMPLTRHVGMVKRLCLKSDDCILLKIYQGLLFRPNDVPEYCYQVVHFQIISFVNNLLSHSEASMVLFPLESDCHCSLELIKCLVLMLNEVLNSLGQLPSDSLSTDTVNSHSLMLLRQGVFLLATLCLNDRLFVEHRVDVEHQYINVVSSVTRLYKRIPGLISEAEVLAVQDLVDFEHIDGIEWSPESDDEVDETVEGMDVDE